MTHLMEHPVNCLHRIDKNVLNVIVSGCWLLQCIQYMKQWSKLPTSEAQKAAEDIESSDGTKKFIYSVCAVDNNECCSWNR